MVFDFGNFIANNWQDIVQFALLGIIAIIQVVKYGKVSKEVKVTMAEKVEKLNENFDKPKFRLPNYRYGISDSEKGGQSFRMVVEELAYDENTGELYVCGMKDLQALIQSSVDCALDKVLDKFGALPPEMQPLPVQSNDVNIVDLRDDLQAASEMFDDFENIRTKYGFSDDLSYNEMFSKLEQMKVDYDTQLKESIANSNSEVKENEKKIVEKA